MADPASTDTVEAPPPRRGVGLAFGRYRFIVDLWPIFTTLMALSGAVGVQLHFASLGLNASQILTLEEYTIQAAFGLVLTVVLIVWLLLSMGLVAILTTTLDLWRERRLTRKAWQEIIPNLLVLRLAMGAILAGFSVVGVLAAGPSQTWAWAILVGFLPLGVALILSASSSRRLQDAGMAIGALGVVIAPAAGVFLSLVLPPPIFDVALLDPGAPGSVGVDLCRGAKLIWHGEKAIVLRCDHELQLLEGPQNIRLSRLLP